VRFAALGRTEWLLDSSIAAQKAGHELRLVATCPPAPEDAVGISDFARLAERAGCPFFADTVINRTEYVQAARSSGAEVALSINWQTMIGPAMLAAFPPHGIVNAHAGDLPRYRGNACPNWAILTGEDRIVVTLHRMVEDLDAGPILLQRALVLGPRSTIGEVRAFIGAVLPDLFLGLLDGLAAGTLHHQEQSGAPSAVLRCYPRLPRDGEIDWRDSTAGIDRLVRASGRPFPGAYSWFQERNGEGPIHKLTIWAARPVSMPGTVLAVPGSVLRVPGEKAWGVVGGDGQAIVLDEVDLDGEPADPAGLFRTARQRLGLDVQGRIAALEARVAALERRLEGDVPA
jgi:methionyl-tRNA formyltransferase